MLFFLTQKLQNFTPQIYPGLQYVTTKDMFYINYLHLLFVVLMWVCGTYLRSGVKKPLDRVIVG